MSSLRLPIRSVLLSSVWMLAGCGATAEFGEVQDPATEDEATRSTADEGENDEQADAQACDILCIDSRLRMSCPTYTDGQIQDLLVEWDVDVADARAAGMTRTELLEELGDEDECDTACRGCLSAIVHRLYP